jgi:hypothetical protein
MGAGVGPVIAAARSRYEESLALRRAAEDFGLIAWGLLDVGHAAWPQYHTHQTSDGHATR